MTGTILGVRRAIAAMALVAAMTADARPVPAYEFETRIRTIGQGYELRSFRFLSPDLFLRRRRFITTMSLDVWDLTGRLERLSLHDPDPGGARVYFSSYLRLEHDFGGFTSGQIRSGNRFVDAVDLIPELEQGSLALELLWGYLAADDLFDGMVDVRVGRLLEIDTLDWWSFDGASVKLTTPMYVAVQAFGGLRVRDDSPLGSSVQEPDGTSGGRCAEYVEGPTPGTGSWRPIDRELLGDDSPFSSDLELCPQREELMPTWGFAVETAGLAPLWARIGYRRSQSRSAGLIGPPDRFEHTDVGYYPNEEGQAPEWGVNEEVVAATLRYNLTFAKGAGQLVPYAAARYSLLHGLIDEAHAGVRLRRGMHAIEPELYYSFPTFDGDSIFNVFSTEPYIDYRMTYELGPRRSPWRLYGRGWLRQFSTEDADRAAPGVDIDPTVFAAGGQVGGRYQPGRHLASRLDLFHEDGYGGRRTGGYLTGNWQAARRVGLGGRLSLIDFDDDLLRDLDGLTFAAQLGATYLINVDGVAVHLLVEETSNRFTPSQIRVIGVLDLAFKPET